MDFNLSRNRRLDIIANIASYRKATAFQSGICSIIANLHTNAEDWSDVKEMFQRLDTDNDGYLRIEDLERGMQEVSAIFHLEP